MARVVEKLVPNAGQIADVVLVLAIEARGAVSGCPVPRGLPSNCWQPRLTSGSAGTDA